MEILMKVDLLKTRYKVIADYYQGQRSIELNKVKVGDIFMNQMPQQTTVWRRVINGQWDVETIHNPQQYGNIFRKLEWHEDRKPEEMPEYVKWVEIGPFGTPLELSGTIEKVEFYQPEGVKAFKVPSQTIPIRVEYFLPATAEQFDHFINSKKP
jgi:hypothetical protein